MRHESSYRLTSERVKVISIFESVELPLCRSGNRPVELKIAVPAFDDANGKTPVDQRANRLTLTRSRLPYRPDISAFIKDFNSIMCSKQTRVEQPHHNNQCVPLDDEAPAFGVFKAALGDSTGTCNKIPKRDTVGQNNMTEDAERVDPNGVDERERNDSIVAVYVYKKRRMSFANKTKASQLSIMAASNALNPRDQTIRLALPIVTKAANADRLAKQRVKLGAKCPAVYPPIAAEMRHSLISRSSNITVSAALAIQLNHFQVDAMKTETKFFHRTLKEVPDTLLVTI